MAFNWESLWNPEHAYLREQIGAMQSGATELEIQLEDFKRQAEERKKEAYRALLEKAAKEGWASSTAMARARADIENQVNNEVSAFETRIRMEKHANYQQIEQAKALATVAGTKPIRELLGLGTDIGMQALGAKAAGGLPGGTTAAGGGGLPEVPGMEGGVDFGGTPTGMAGTGGVPGLPGSPAARRVGEIANEYETIPTPGPNYAASRTSTPELMIGALTAPATETMFGTQPSPVAEAGARSAMVRTDSIAPLMGMGYDRPTGQESMEELRRRRARAGLGLGLGWG